MNSFFRQISFFTKSQKRGLIAVVLLLFIVIAANIFVSEFFRSAAPATTNDSVFLSQVEDFKSGLSAKSYGDYYKTYSPSDFMESGGNNMFGRQAQLFEFDPNTLDSVGFVSLGLKPFVAKNIVNYRKKGGRFRKDDDFARIYGLTSSDFERLKPYIHIAEVAESKTATAITQNTEPQEETTVKKYDPDLMIELNTADTTELKKLYGIGSYFARQIVYYRNRLGGYYSVDQLLEIKNFSAETFEKIKNNITADPSLIKKININWATAEKLSNHPYLNFYQSRAIFELRKKKKFKNIDDFRQIKELSDEDIKKIGHYIKF